ncbi:hypothetical protein DITRI_Ditri14bG0066000 [Diplodiscus trichospermus]
MRTKQRNQKRCPSVPSNLYNRNIKTLLVGFTPFCESLELSSTKTQSFSQGFGCYVLNEQMINKPLEEMMGKLLEIYLVAATELFDNSMSAGIYMFAEGTCLQLARSRIEFARASSIDLESKTT